ncbi:hypothetical protein OL229_00565 [Neisseriaceae bacterium JH1-16]|nr:hypothetical protein [Neisseriaceae bacterium JH1-16]
MIHASEILNVSFSKTTQIYPTFKRQNQEPAKFAAAVGNWRQINNSAGGNFDRNSGPKPGTARLDDNQIFTKAR